MKILFVCTGNTCRSPLAEGYLKSKNLPCLEILSAGISAGRQKASENAILAASHFGFDISEHISRPLTAEMLENSDKIYCMGVSHAEYLKSFCPAKKINILGGGIPDPFELSLDYYLQTAENIINAIDSIFADIIPAGRDDAKDLSTIERLCFSAPWSESALRQSLENGTVMYKAVIKNKTVGYLGINTVLDEGYITNIGVLPEFRGNGIGQRLLEKAEADFKNTLSFISLEVRPTNDAAISLYEKLGYEKQGERKNFYINPTENAVIMTKGLR